VIAGGDTTSSAASAALTALQEHANLLVFTTNMGKGAVDETHPLSAGTLGSLTGPGSLGRYARELLAKADVVLRAGTRTNEDGTDSWQLIPPGAGVIHIDIDAGTPRDTGQAHRADDRGR
jgi:acetolactate synthase I/II/III large subunit